MRVGRETSTAKRSESLGIKTEPNAVYFTEGLKALSLSLSLPLRINEGCAMALVARIKEVMTGWRGLATRRNNPWIRGHGCWNNRIV